MRQMIVGAAAALALMAAGATYLAAPSSHATEYNRLALNVCAQIRATHPQAQCPPQQRDTFDTGWLLIAAVLGVGASIVMALGLRRLD